MGMDAVRLALNLQRIAQYGDTLEAKGYDDLSWLKRKSKADLYSLGTQSLRMKEGHAHRFAELSAAVGV